MASSTLTTIKKRVYSFKWQESYAGLVLGAIVVVILGLLVANYFTKSRGQIGVGESISQEQQTAAITYRVAQGESLSLIANKTYGSYDYWPVLAKVNNISNPNLIYVNSEINLPSKEEADSMLAEITTTTTYQVKEGDTLFIIAQNLYGDGSKWTQIDTANKVGRLPNGNPLIFTGTTLVIPR